MRGWTKAFLREGSDALSDTPRLGQTSSVTPASTEAPRTGLREGGPTWTARQLFDWLAEAYGLRLDRDYLARRMRQAGLSYKRSRRALRHEHDPLQVQEKRLELEALEKG